MNDNTLTYNSNFDINCLLAAIETLNYIYSVGLIDIKKSYVMEHKVAVSKIIQKNVGGNVTFTFSN